MGIMAFMFITVMTEYSKNHGHWLRIFVISCIFIWFYYGSFGWLNSLAPEGFDYSLNLENFKLISAINILSIFCEIPIRWMPQHLIDH